MRLSRFSTWVVMAVATTVLSFTSQSGLAQRATELTDFNFTNGAYPMTPVVFDSRGNLYGTTNGGGKFGSEFNGGTVFELVPQSDGSWTEKALYSFGNGFNGVSLDGYYPNGIVFDAAGNLYGTALEGGDYSRSREGLGVVFKLTKSDGGNWTETVIHAFGTLVLDGATPEAGVTLDAAGNIFGTTGGGGLYTWGTVYELTPAADGTWTLSVLHSFNNNGKDGHDPTSTLIFDSNGNLYGACPLGGRYGYGIVFELIPQKDGSWKEKVLHDFIGGFIDGSFPVAGLILDKEGNLYGSTQGSSGVGRAIVFELMPQADGRWQEKILHTFGLNSGDGAEPTSPLSMDNTGNLYGTTFYGGPFYDGTVFKLMPQPDGSWAENILYVFGGFGIADGLNPDGGVILDESGNLYGTTKNGGEYGDGTVFEITP